MEKEQVTPLLALLIAAVAAECAVFVRLVVQLRHIATTGERQ